MIYIASAVDAMSVYNPRINKCSNSVLDFDT